VVAFDVRNIPNIFGILSQWIAGKLSGFCPRENWEVERE
jgi:hypothetical protein